MSKLVKDPVHTTIIWMAVPMLAGTFSMNMYHLTNAWFVSRLGTEALAAISFTFPAIMLLMCITRGLSSGAMTLVAHALGGKEKEKAATLTAHAFLLALTFAVILSVAGLATIRPLFSALGASGEVLDQTSAYMRVWYLGCVVMVLQMAASDIIIATGNTKVISALLLGSTLANLFFDYGLIFGNLGMPRMGIVGAGFATIIAQGLSLCGALFILQRKFGLLQFHRGHFNGILDSWMKILKFGVPGALGMIMTPVASAIITRLVAGHGHAAVAALGVAGRIEMFAFMIPMTVGMSLIPFIAQNYGAGRIDRVRTARSGTMIFAVLYGLFIGVMFITFAESMAKVFSDEKEVVDVLKAYIYITCAGYGMLEVHRYAGFCLTGTHEPLQASLLNIVRVVALLIPFSFLGSHLFQLNGIFFGRLATDLLAGGLGIWWSGHILKQAEQRRFLRENRA